VTIVRDDQHASFVYRRQHNHQGRHHTIKFFAVPMRQKKLPCSYTFIKTVEERVVKTCQFLISQQVISCSVLASAAVKLPPLYSMKVPWSPP
jgi:hypothetical protein